MWNSDAWYISRFSKVSIIHVAWHFTQFSGYIFDWIHYSKMMMWSFLSNCIFYKNMVASDWTIFPSLCQWSNCTYPIAVLAVNCPPFLLESFSSGSNTFKQFALVNSPIYLFVFHGKEIAIALKCFNFFVFSLVGASSASACTLSLVYI